MTDRSFRDRIRQKTKAKQIKRELIIASKARVVITQYLQGKDPKQCMDELKQLAKE